MPRRMGRSLACCEAGRFAAAAAAVGMGPGGALRGVQQDTGPQAAGLLSEPGQLQGAATPLQAWHVALAFQEEGGWLRAAAAAAAAAVLH